MNEVSRFLRNLAGLFPIEIAPRSESVADKTLDSGWWELDQIFKVYPGQFVVVTGKSGHGKSTFLFNLIMNLCKRCDKRAYLYIPENEMYIRENLRRICADDDAFQRLAQDNIYVQMSGYEHYSDEPHTIDWILDSAYGAMQVYGIDFIVIDPWNELERAKPKDQMLVDYIGECLRMVRIFAQATKTTVFVSVHPTKAANERQVTLGDCEGANHWWNKCDNGLIIERELDGPVAKVASAKVREIGAGKRGVCYFDVDENTGIFTPQKGAVSL